MKMFALHMQVMSNNAKSGNVIMAHGDIVARLTKNVYGGAKVVYDDKAKTLEQQQYGLFWKAQKNFLIGLEYSQTGDKTALNASLNHKVNLTTEVGNIISYDLNLKRITNQTVLSKRVDPSTTLKGRIDNGGFFDFSVSGAISPSLTATFTTGGSLSNVFDGQAKADPITYAGLAFNFTAL